MHLRCPCTAAMATADPPAPTEHIGSERAHARGLPAMLQLCSPSMSRPAQIKEQLELDVEEHRRIAERHYTRTASGRVVTVGDLPRRSARGPQLSLRVGARWIQSSAPRMTQFTQVLHSISKYYTVYPSITQNTQVLHSISKYYTGISKYM